jgi:hypothetical protein
MAKIHHSLTLNRVLAAVEESAFGLTDTGLCIKCGAELLHCEPDAEQYRCEECDSRSVYGAEQILLRFGNLLKPKPLGVKVSTHG